MRYLASGLIVAAVLAFANGPSSVWAQQASQSQGGQQQAPLSPALQAAVTSGNAQAVARAIQALSGGNTASAANLAAQVIAAAERMLATNPTAAIEIAKSAVEQVKSQPVSASAPVQTQTVLTTAARIFVSPTAIRVAPEQVGQLATSTMAAASATGNAALQSSIANSAVSTAEKLLATNPAAAVAVASASVEAVKNTPVQNSNPQQTMQTITTAARIMVRPEAQAINPQAVAQMSISVATIASNPVVYQASPTAALAAMDSANTTAKSPTIQAAAPGASASVVGVLVGAAANPSLISVNPGNGVAVDTILNKPVTTTVQQPDKVDTPQPEKASAS